MAYHPRVKNADRTAVLVAAVKKLENTKFHDKMMGSGLILSILDLEGREICEEFCIPGEDMDAIKPAIIASIKTALTRRKLLLANEIKSIEDLS